MPLKNSVHPNAPPKKKFANPSAVFKFYNKDAPNIAFKLIRENPKFKDKVNKADVEFETMLSTYNADFAKWEAENPEEAVAHAKKVAESKLKRKQGTALRSQRKKALAAAATETHESESEQSSNHVEEEEEEPVEEEEEEEEEVVVAPVVPKRSGKTARVDLESKTKRHHGKEAIDPLSSFKQICADVTNSDIKDLKEVVDMFQTVQTQTEDSFTEVKQDYETVKHKILELDTQMKGIQTATNKLMETLEGISAEIIKRRKNRDEDAN